MMFFARGLKCGGLGDIGETGAGASAPKIFWSSSNDASAIPPSPSAQRPKKCRRVKSRSESFMLGRSIITLKTTAAGWPAFPRSEIPGNARALKAVDRVDRTIGPGHPDQSNCHHVQIVLRSFAHFSDWNEPLPRSGKN